MIYYTGDIHGSAKGIVAFAQHYELTESDIIVILGDVGANYYGNRRDRYCKDALARIMLWGFPCILAGNQFGFRNRLAESEKQFKTMEEVQQDWEVFLKSPDPDYSEFCNDIFGDG